MYATWDGSSWNTLTVANGDAFSLALDANGSSHILYRSGAALMYAYAWRTNTVWAIQTVDRTFRNGFGVIALDSRGNPHVAYTDGTTVKYASLTGSTWNIQTVDTYVAGGISEQLSLAIDQNNTPYIMYSIPSSNEDKSTGINYSSVIVKLAVGNNSGWSIENVSLPPPVGAFGNMVLDSTGYPHFTCTQSHFLSAKDMTLVSNLLYVSWNGSVWKTQTIVSKDQVGPGYLALDSLDSPHIVYIRSSSEMMYASWQGLTGAFKA
jgi:hypothetical protein